MLKPKPTIGDTTWFVQDRFGMLHIILKDDLPEVIHTSAGERFKGAHLAQILLNPKSIKKPKPYTAAVANPFPALRDLGNMAFGVLGFLLVRFFLNLVAAM